ncbi:MAG: ABC transporter permease [Opitutaceae bacterium]|nr:ABC transporter permease [Opitutaceae bacterium]
MKTLLAKLRALVRRRNLEAEMMEEMRQHLERRTQEKIADGLSFDEARYAAQREFGGVAQLQEQCRDERSFISVEQFVRDVRYAARSLRKNPGFTITAVATVALCLGTNLTLFALIDSILLRPLPFPHAERLVTIFNTYPKAGVERDGASLTNYYERRGQIAAFSDLALFRAESATVGESGVTDRVDVARVSPDFFSTLGVALQLGRPFREEEATQQTQRVAILTDRCWRERFNADPQVIGRTLRVNEVAREIVGVLPADFRFLSSTAQLYLPLASDPQSRSPAARHSGNSIEMIARLRPGVTLADAQAEVDAHDASVAETYPQPKLISDAGFRSVVVPLQGDHVRAIRPMLLLLQAGALLLLLLSSINLVGLLLVRASGRAHEVAVRRALGAASRHIVTASVVETVLLAVVGAAGGVILAAFGVDVIRVLGGDRLPLGATIAFGARSAMVGCLSGTVLGLALGVPVAWFHVRPGLGGVLHSTARGGHENRATRRLRNGLVVAQIALAFGLLAGAGLLGLSLHRVMAVSPGFRPDHVLSGALTLPARTYDSRSRLLTFADRLADKILRRPGVTAVGIGTRLPFAGNNVKSAITVKGYVAPPGDSVRGVYTYGVTGDYFGAMGIPLLRGRVLTADDSRGNVRVCVVDEDFARRHWAKGDPLGQRLFDGSTERPDAEGFTIVGVVGAVKQAGLAETPTGAVYFPLRYRSDFNIFVVVRATTLPTTFGATLASIVRQLDPELPLSDLRTMDERITNSLVTRRSPALLASLFAVGALLLTALGTYGVVGYAVAQRRREIGVRLALGAEPRQIRDHFLAFSLRLLAAGVGLGLVAAWCIGRALQTLLFNVPTIHLGTITGSAAVLALASLLACWLPARRAAKVDPIVALRCE